MRHAGGGRPRAGLAYGVVVTVLAAAAGFTFWYRAAYNVMPGQGASSRVHWCGRDYGSVGSSPRTWQQISAQQRSPVRAVGRYPPLGLGGQELFAAVTPGAQRSSASPPPPCAMIVYLRTRSNEYVAYPIEVGP
jgi:hypothetical protein